MTKEELKKEAQEQVNCCTPLYPECFIQGYIAGAEPRENKIADIKANCDLAIEGRDVKIMELEKENAELESDFRICEKNADTYYDQLTKAKEIIRTFLNMPMPNNEEVFADVGVFLTKAEQFLKEIEK